MTVVRAAIDTRPRNNRAAITNNPRRLQGIDARTAEGRRTRDLLEGFVAALGGYDALTDGQLTDVRRAAELTTLAERARMQALQTPGVVDLTALVKLEGAADRAVRRLGIAPGAHSKPVPTLADHVAAKARQKAADTLSTPSATTPVPVASERAAGASPGDGAPHGG